MFKNCKTIYFKTQDVQNYLNHDLRGKIIISDFQELNRICNLYGLIHVLNTNTQRVPEGVDVVVCNSRNPEVESRITRNKLQIPIVYLQLHKKWCGICGKLNPLDLKINKYCSEACMKKTIGFTMDGLPEVVKDLGFTRKTIIKFDKSLSDNRRAKSSTKEDARKKSRDKFQNSMIKEANRVLYAEKKEMYKKEMRQPSHRKTKIASNKKTEDTNE